MVDDATPPERPRVEPEIIPPDHNQGQSAWRQSTWRQSARPNVFTQAGGTHRVYVGRIGPFGIALLMLAAAAVAAIILLVLLGVMLLWIPVVAVLVVVAALFRFLR